MIFGSHPVIDSGHVFAEGRADYVNFVEPTCRDDVQSGLFMVAHRD